MIDLIYEDKHLIALNKEPGIVVFSNEGETLSRSIISSYPSLKGVGGERNGAVHRLDKDTSGVVLFAKNEKVFHFLQKQFLERKTKKRYIALVFKCVTKDSGEITASIGRSQKDRRKQRAYPGEKGKRDAITSFRTLKRFETHSLLEVFPKTGRKHQIRCHLAYIGHPVAGDKLYGFKDQIDPPGLKRHFLHAESIEIEVPDGGTKKISALLNNDLKVVLENLIKYSVKIEN